MLLTCWKCLICTDWLAYSANRKGPTFYSLAITFCLGDVILGKIET